MYDVKTRSSIVRNDEELNAIIHGIGKFLPCDKCRRHFVEYSNGHVLTASNVQEWMDGLKVSIQNQKKNEKKIEKIEKIEKIAEKTQCCGKQRMLDTPKRSIIKRLQTLF